MIDKYINVIIKTILCLFKVNINLEYFPGNNCMIILSLNYYNLKKYKIVAFKK